VQELTHGFQIEGTHIARLRLAFELSADELDGMPVYRSIDGTAGLYFSQSRWLFLAVYSLEQAKKKQTNSMSPTVKDGRVPLGERQWKCYVDSKWEERSVTLTALTAAEMEAAKEEAKEAAAAAAAAAADQKQAALQQSEEVRKIGCLSLHHKSNRCHFLMISLSLLRLSHVASVV